MKCVSCNTHMQLSKAESSSVSSTEWYKCPCCGRSRLTAEPRGYADSLLASKNSYTSKLNKPIDYVSR